MSSTEVSEPSVRTLLRWWQRFPQWTACRGTEPVGRLLEAAPAAALEAFRPASATPEAVARFLFETGAALETVEFVVVKSTTTPLLPPVPPPGEWPLKFRDLQGTKNGPGLEVLR